MKLKINLKNVVWFILFVFLFEPTIFIKITKLNFLFIGGICVTFIYCCYKYYIEDRKISKLLLLTVILRIILLIPTMFNDGDIIKWGYQTLNYMSVIMMIEIGFYKDAHKTLKMIQILFLTYLSINLFLYIKYPQGIFKQYWGLHFLGVRTRFTDYFFVLIAITLVNSKENKKLNIICLAVSLITMFYAWISTPIAGIAIALIVYSIISKTKLKINSSTLIGVALIIAMSITFFRVQNVFSNIIENVLHKSITLTGRTEIWDLSYKYIKESPILGHGYHNDGNFVYWNGEYWQAHNQFLQNLYDGGIVYFIIFISILVIVVSKCDIKNKNCKILVSFLFAFIIMMISEIYAYYPALYVFFAIIYYSKYIEESEVKKNE